MIRKFCTVRSGLAISMTALALTSLGCSDNVGGIVVEPDGAGGGGAKDGSIDNRAGAGGASAGSGGAAGTPQSDGATVDTTADIAAETGGDGSTPPLCIYHTDPPTTFSSLDDSGTDAANDATSNEGGMDAGPPDVQSQDVGSSVDAMADIVVDTSQPPVDASSDPTGDATSGDAISERRDGTAEGGDGAIPTSITVLSSPFLGPYLADSAGRTLYTFGNDHAGDCKNPPVPDCEADCATAWPPFDAGKRTLPPSLNPMAFGSVVRPDGISNITSYYGWPLYYYRPDVTSGAITGHGKSKTWHVATVTPANMMIMRDKTNPRYVADGNGFTLYTYDQDTVGTATSDPKSACVGACATDHPPFLLNRINAVSSLDPNFTDLGLFVRPDTGRQQVAYKGMPLYLSSTDMRSGDQSGITTGWTIALAP